MELPALRKRMALHPKRICVLRMWVANLEKATQLDERVRQQGQSWMDKATEDWHPIFAGQENIFWQV